MPPSIPISSKHGEAFEKCAQGLAPDMPLLMHGAGDVVPGSVNEESASLLARFTANYIQQLVSAAVDAHDILTDGAGGVLPPPSYPAKILHPVPYSEERKRKKPGVEYWDDPLPPPKIKGDKSKSKLSTTAASATQPWVGAQGLDLFRVSRSRRRHLQQAIGAQSFVFPVWHDAELYQKALHLQAREPDVADVIQDNVLLDFCKTELQKASTKKKTKLKSKTTRDSAEEENEEEEAGEEVMPEWPGFETLLPVHKFMAEAAAESLATDSKST